MGFNGFPSDSIAFLRAMRANNSKAWFDGHRTDYERWYLAPAVDFVNAAAPILRKWSPAIEAQPKILGSIFRINRDVRFSKDKRAYKDHLDLWFWEGERRSAVSGYFMRVSPDFVGIGAGTHGFDAEQWPRFQRVLANGESGAQLEAIVASLEASGHPVRRGRALYVHHDEDAALALDGPGLLEVCDRLWGDLTPLHRWLVDHVQAPVGS